MKIINFNLSNEIIFKISNASKCRVIYILLDIILYMLISYIFQNNQIIK